MAEAIINVLLFALFCYGNNAADVNDRYYPRYHLAPPHGWMNDPNGFSVFKNDYHLFYQYNPESSLAPGIAHWGHAKSKDMFHWEHQPIAMYPDKWYDKTGVFSGSAIVEDDKMYIFYTGNVKLEGQTNPHEEFQCLATSTDGVTVTKYEGNPIINATDRQPDIRDPKVWKNGDTYYMVLGNSFKNSTLGRILLYTSKDKINWQEASILGESDGFLGYMWECPDLFELDGRFVLLFSPQGVKPQGDKYRNLYQTGYIIGSFDYTTNKFVQESKFIEIDHGHDFYATQTILDNHGRRIVVGWFDMWDQNYPEGKDGWTGHMTIPRELSLTHDGRLVQRPVYEIRRIADRLLYSGRARGGHAITIPNNAGEINIIASKYRDLEIILEAANSTVVTLSYSTRGRVTLDRGGSDGVRTTKWRPVGALKWRIFIDASSIELFCGEGEVTFSSRFFPEGPVSVKLSKYTKVESLRVSSIKRTLPKP